jgi:hypothetical protein
MMSNTHALFCKKTLKTDDPLILIGSILPDIAVTGVIGWDDSLHEEKVINKFEKFIDLNYPSYFGLARGIKSHNLLDHYTHNEYQGGKGYAYRNNEIMVTLVSKYYHLDSDKATGIAHNYIETAVDILLMKKYGFIIHSLNDASKSPKMSLLPQILSGFFSDTRVDDMSKACKTFFRIFSNDELSNTDYWTVTWRKLNELLNLRTISRRNIEKLISESLKAVEGTYRNFFDDSLKNGNINFK